MQYCKNCGTELKKEQKFCPVCGLQQTKQLMEDQPENLQAQDRLHKLRSIEKNFFQSKLSKIIMAVVVVILVMLFGTYKYLASTMTPDKIESKFADAVKNSNVAEMKSILDNNRPDFTINDDGVKSFIAYFKNHPDEFSQTINNLKQDVSEGGSDNNHSVSIIKDGKKWLFFDYYALNLQPYYIDVTSSRNPTAVYINGKPVGNASDKKSTFGPYLLSDFTIKGTYKGAYTTITKTVTIDPTSSDGQHLTADLNVDGHTVSINSNDDQAILYVNGKSTGKKIVDVNTLGPVPLDGSIKLQAIEQNGSSKTTSNVVPITEDNQAVDLEFYNDSSGAANVSMISSDSPYTLGPDDAAQVVKEHYSDISMGDYVDAYNLMSSSRKAKLSLDGFTKGLLNNRENDVTINNVSVSSDDTTAVVTFNLVSYDNQANGGTLVQTWEGTWNLVSENNQWRLDTPHIKKQGSYTE